MASHGIEACKWVEWDLGEGRGENVIALLSAKNCKSQRFSGISAFGRAEIIFVACNFIGTRTYFCGFGSQIGGTVLVSVGDCQSPV